MGPSSLSVMSALLSSPVAWTAVLAWFGKLIKRALWTEDHMVRTSDAFAFLILAVSSWI